MSETDLEEIDMSAKSSATPSLAARAGRWSAQHRKKAIWGWLAFALIAFMIGGALGTKTQTTAQSGVGESGRAARTVDGAFPKHQVEQVLIRSDRATATDPCLSAAPYTKAFESPYKPGNAGQISADGHSALLRFQIAGDEDQAKDRVGATLTATAAVQAANPDFTVEQVGDASINKQLNDSINKDFSRAFVTSLPITLAILLIAFGALVAASLPILLAMTAVLATIGLVAVTSQFSPVDSSINEVILLIGLAVGVDYSMFYLRREREERASGRSPEASLEAAAATSGRAVLVSGLTVMIAEGAASFRGRVMVAEGQSLPPNLRVYLVPAEKEGVADVLRFFETRADTDGSFALGNIAPGHYWMVGRAANEAEPATVKPIRQDSALRSQVVKEAEKTRYEIQLQPCQRIVDYEIRYPPAANDARPKP